MNDLIVLSWSGTYLYKAHPLYSYSGNSRFLRIPKQLMPRSCSPFIQVPVVPAKIKILGKTLVMIAQHSISVNGVNLQFSISKNRQVQCHLLVHLLFKSGCSCQKFAVLGHYLFFFFFSFLLIMITLPDSSVWPRVTQSLLCSKLILNHHIQKSGRKSCDHL